MRPGQLSLNNRWQQSPRLLAVGKRTVLVLAPSMMRGTGSPATVRAAILLAWACTPTISCTAAFASALATRPPCPPPNGAPPRSSVSGHGEARQHQHWRPSGVAPVGGPTGRRGSRRSPGARAGPHIPGDHNTNTPPRPCRLRARPGPWHRLWAATREKREQGRGWRATTRCQATLHWPLLGDHDGQTYQTPSRSATSAALVTARCRVATCDVLGGICFLCGFLFRKATSSTCDNFLFGENPRQNYELLVSCLGRSRFVCLYVN